MNHSLFLCFCAPLCGVVFFTMLDTPQACAPILQPALLSRQWPREQYLLLYQPGDNQAKNMAVEQLLEKAKGQWLGQCNVQLVALPAKGQAPTISLLSPRGRLIKTLDDQIGQEQLEKLFVSPARKKIREAYGDSNLLVLVHWRWGERKIDEHNRQAIKTCREFFTQNGRKIGFAEAGVKDENECILRACLKLSTDEYPFWPSATVLLWQGKPFTTLYGEIDKDALVDRVNTAYQLKEKSILPQHYPENVLLYWPEK